LSESLFTAPHFYITMSIDMDAAVAARAKINEVAPVKISFNDMVVKATALSLKQHPKINSSWLGDSIRTNHHVNIGIAVAVDEGLLVPVLRFADGLSLSQISGNVKEFAKKAKDKNSQDIEANALKAGLLKENGGYYKIVGGPPQIKNFAKMSMPSITIGTVNSAVLTAGAQSMNDSKDATIHMLRSQKNAGSPTEAPSDEQDRGLPMRMMPFDISIDTLGCPFLAHTQQFFVDFGTNTSIDNIYAVCGVEHKLEPGSFTTSTKLIPVADAYGGYESLISTLDKAFSATNSKSNTDQAGKTEKKASGK
jgi:hypothetical protein